MGAHLACIYFGVEGSIGKPFQQWVQKVRECPCLSRQFSSFFRLVCVCVCMCVCVCVGGGTACRYTVQIRYYTKRLYHVVSFSKALEWHGFCFILQTCLLCLFLIPAPGLTWPQSFFEKAWMEQHSVLTCFDQTTITGLRIAPPKMKITSSMLPVVCERSFKKASMFLVNNSHVEQSNVCLGFC